MSGKWKISLPANENFNAFAEGVLFKNGRTELTQDKVKGKAKVEEVIKALEALGFICEPVINEDGTVWDSEVEAAKEEAKAEMKLEASERRVLAANKVRETAIDPKKAKAQAREERRARAEKFDEDAGSGHEGVDLFNEQEGEKPKRSSKADDAPNKPKTSVADKFDK